MAILAVDYYIDEGVDKEVAGVGDIFLVAEKGYGAEDWFEVYNPVGKKKRIDDLDELDECIKITKEEYMKISEGYVIPEEYL